MVSKYYEYATWILGIIVIILAILLFRAQNASLDDNLDMAIENLRECNADLSAWRAENPSPSASTADQQKELSEILSRCAESTGVVDSSAPDIGPEAGSLKQ